MDDKTYSYAEKRYEPTYFDGEYQGHKVTTNAKVIGTEVSNSMDDLESKQKLRAYREKIVELQKKLEEACAQGLQHRKERDQMFQNFREACRVGLEHRGERDAIGKRMTKVMRENQSVRDRNGELQDRIDGLYRALYHKPYDCDDKPLPEPKGWSTYLWLTLVASLVASVPVVQAICVAMGVE